MVKTLHSCERLLRASKPKQGEESSDNRATFLHLYEDLEEIVHLLKIADRSVRAGARLAPAVREIHERPGAHTFAAESDEAVTLSREGECRAEVLVLNKAVHEWFNHVSVALKQNQPLLFTIPSDLRRKLSYVVLVRDKLLTHKKDLTSLRSGSTFYENMATARVSRLPLGLPDEVMAEISGIFNGSLEELPAEHRAETNVYSRFGLLAEFHETLKSHYRARIKSLVEKYGAECSSLEELAVLGGHIAEAVLLLLAETLGTLEQSGT